MLGPRPRLKESHGWTRLDCLTRPSRSCRLRLFSCWALRVGGRRDARPVSNLWAFGFELLHFGSRIQLCYLIAIHLLLYCYLTLLSQKNLFKPHILFSCNSAKRCNVAERTQTGVMRPNSGKPENCCSVDGCHSADRRTMSEFATGRLGRGRIPFKEGRKRSSEAVPEQPAKDRVCRLRRTEFNAFASNLLSASTDSGTSPRDQVQVSASPRGPSSKSAGHSCRGPH